MGTGYTRNDVSNNIADGNIINAADLDGEFDAVESAFNSSTGHTHDGTAAEGGPITVVGPVQDLVVSATEVKPKTTNTLDLGTSGLLYKDAYLQGNMYFRDTALKIVSSADGQLDIDADVELELVAPTVDIDASTAVTVDTASTTFTSTLFNVTGSANITGDLDVDNININGNTIISTDTNGDINISPDGTGTVVIDTDLDVDNINVNGNTISSTDSNGNINLSPNGTGTVVINTDLDVDNININGNTIISTNTNGDINLSPNGTGRVIVNTDFRADNLKLDGNTISATDTNGNVVIQPNGTGDTIINEDGNNSVFRVESNNKDSMLYVDGANDHVNIGTSTDYGGVLNVVSTDNASTVRLVCTDADANDGPLLDLVRYSSSPADNDTLGSIRFRAYDDLSSETQYADFRSFATDVTAGTEDARLELRTMVNGTLYSRLNVKSGEIVINDGSIDADFRVESNGNSNMLFVDGGNNRVGIGTNSPSNTLTVNSSGGNPTTFNGASSGGYVYIDVQNTSSGATGNGAGIEFRAFSDSNERQVGYIRSSFTDITDASRDSDMEFLTAYNGGSNTWMKYSSTEVVLNALKHDIDFRVASDDKDYGLFLDAAQNLVGIANDGSDASPQGGTLTTTPIDSATGRGQLRIGDNTTTSNGVAELRLMGYASGNNSGGGHIYFDNTRWNGTNSQLGAITCTRDGTYAGTMEFYVSNGGYTEHLALNSGNNESVFNEDSSALDFRVESNGNSNMLYVDGTNDRVGIGYGSPQSSLHIRTNSPVLTLDDANNGTGGSSYTPHILFDASGTEVGKLGFTGSGTEFNLQIENYNSARFAIHTGGSNERMRITNGGQVIFNEDSLDQDFRVESNAYSYMLAVDAGSNVLQVGTNRTASVAGFTSMLALLDMNSNKHGMEINNPATSGSFRNLILTSAESDAHFVEFRYTTTEIGGIDSDGTTGVIYSTTSDRRLKTDIQPIDDATDKLMAMNPVVHKWKEHPEKDAVHGFIAQEMIDIVPESVSGTPDGESMMSMDYGRITPVLVAALQDAHKKIEQLEARIATLEEK